MLWLMVYVTVAVAVLSVLGAGYAKNAHHDPARLLMIIATAACWPIVALGLLQFEAILLLARRLRRHEPEQLPMPV